MKVESKLDWDSCREFIKGYVIASLAEMACLLSRQEGIGGGFVYEESCCLFCDASSIALAWPFLYSAAFKPAP